MRLQATTGPQPLGHPQPAGWICQRVQILGTLSGPDASYPTRRGAETGLGPDPGVLGPYALGSAGAKLRLIAERKKGRAA